MKQRTGWRKAVRKSAVPWLYIAPAGLLMLVITLIPQLFQWWMSFTDFSIQNLRFNPLLPSSYKFAPDYVGFRNFIDILRSDIPIPDYNFVRLLLFNITWTISNVLFHTAIGIGIALALNTKNLIGKRIYRSMFIIPWAVPAMVTASVWRNMFHERFGAINQLFDLINSTIGTAIPHTTRWLAQVDNEGVLALLPLSFFAAFITNVWLGWPFMMVVATGALQSISNDMYEAAEMDGATAWQQFWRITLPLIRPAMVPAIMLGTIWTFNQFNVIYFVTNGGPKGRTEIMITQAYKLVFTQRLYGYAAAFSIVVFFILLLFTLLQNRVTWATESYDA